MEAVGRLAGGVAHDFNNLLSVILSYADLLLGTIEADDPIHSDVEEIRKAGQRASELTLQLLQFSRQQVIKPKVFELSAVLSGMQKMLAPLIGEDVELTLALGSNGCVLVDPGGIEQVVVNLVVNARDAMPKGGSIRIETSDVLLDEDFASGHVGVKAGRYVALAVTDDGCGMDDATQAHIFEPFFTTKEKGKGTGLGLSTVFGIVTQSGGSVVVDSSPGAGTTFRVLLPQVDAEPGGHAQNAAPATLRGTETILLVEDDTQVLAVARSILKRRGYTLLDARNGAEAIALSERHQGTIHLLVTDVVMPQMSGPEVARRVAMARPDTRVLYLSGYTDDSTFRHGIQEERRAFLQKPIMPESLALKVREVLDAPHA
jgi:CheY-like chemotaxis protein